MEDKALTEISEDATPEPGCCSSVNLDPNVSLPFSFPIRQKQHGSQALIPVNDMEGSEVFEVAEAGRATLWCQVS